MILAAAIKFYIDKTNEEVILCGHRHWNVFEQLKLLGFEPKKGYHEIAQGFINDKNEFLTREEAFEYAIKCGQIHDDRDIGDCCERLVSEDLW